jgi:hypothetical protein
MSRPAWHGADIARDGSRPQTVHPQSKSDILSHYAVAFPSLPARLSPRRSCSDKLSQLVPSRLNPSGFSWFETNCPRLWKEHRFHGRPWNLQAGRSPPRHGALARPDLAKGPRLNRNSSRVACQSYGSDILSRHATPILHPPAPTAGRVEMCDRVEPRFCSLRVKRHEQAGVYHPRSTAPECRRVPSEARGRHPAVNHHFSWIPCRGEAPFRHKASSGVWSPSNCTERGQRP